MSNLLENRALLSQQQLVDRRKIASTRRCSSGQGDEELMASTKAYGFGGAAKPTSPSVFFLVGGRLTVRASRAFIKTEAAQLPQCVYM